MARDPKARELVQFNDPFSGMPIAERKKLLREVGVKAREKFEALKADIDNQLQQLEPIHCMCLAAYYLIFVVNRQSPDSSDSFGQHKAELLQALLLRHPIEFYNSEVGTPDQVQAALDLSRNLVDERLRIPYADMPEDDESYARIRVVEEMRTYTQVMRGEWYPEQLNRLFRPSLERVINPFVKAHGISATTVYDLIQRLSLRIQDRLNTHVGKVGAFIKEQTLAGMVKAYKKSFPNVTLDVAELRELFEGKPDREIHEPARAMLLGHSDLRVSEIFSISAAEIESELKAIDGAADAVAAKALIEKLSMKFGATAEKLIDHIILDNPVWSHPFVKFDDHFYLPLPTTFTSYCQDIFLGLAQANEELKAAFEEARAKFLEDATADLLKESLPTAKLWQSVRWKDEASGKEYENDIVLLIDRWLLLVEAKSGQVTDSARRGSYDRLKREIKKLMVDPSDQSRRLTELLTTERRLHKLQCREGACDIDSSALDGVIRINVTNESIGNLNSRGGSLVDAGLVPKGTDLAPTMSLSSLDLVVQLIGSQGAILHYLSRRKAFEENALYLADELDLVAFYLKNGFNIGESEIDGTMLMIYGISNDLDRKLTRADKKLGKQEAPAITSYWDRFLQVLEKSNREGWLMLVMRLRNVSAEDQKRLEKEIRRAVYRYKKHGPLFGQATYGPKSRREGLIVVVSDGKSANGELEAEVISIYQKIVAEGIANPTLLSVAPPLAGVLKRVSVVTSADEAVAVLAE